MKKQTKIIITAISVIALIVGMIGAYIAFKPETQEGSKTITLEVFDEKGNTTTYTIKTDGEYFIDVMEAAKKEGFSFEGEDGPYGLSIHTVNGTVADYDTDGAYWGFYINDEYCKLGVESQPVSDGDVCAIRYTIMY